MDRSGFRLRRAGLAAVVLLLLSSPSLPAAGFFDHSQPGFLARVWDGLLHLWDKEGGGLDPDGRPAAADAGSGLDPSGLPTSSDAGPGLDPSGVR